MVDLDSTQREARAREVRHEVVVQLMVAAHGVFRILFIVQWAVALCLAWSRGAPDESRLLFTLLLVRLYLIRPRPALETAHG